MNVWPTVLKQAIHAKRGGPYFLAVWLVGAVAMTAALWPQCPHPFESIEGMGWRLAGVFWITLGVVAWALLRQGLDTQLSPAAVQLVPGVRRAAIIVTIVSWLVMATALALETCVYDVPFPWIFAALLIVMAITVSRKPTLQKIGLLLPVVVWPPIYGARFLLPVGPDPNPSLGWAAVLLAIAMGTMFILTELGKSAEVHGVLYTRLVQSQSVLQDQRDQRPQWMWDSILKRPNMFQWVFDRMLRARSPEVRLLHGMGPVFHWSQSVLAGVLQAVPFCLITYVASVVFEPYGGRDQLGVDLVLMNASTISFGFTIVLADDRMRELWGRSREQALLVIVPGAPRGSDVNRWLMQTLVLQHAIAVVSALWFVTAMALALEQPLESTLKATSAPLAASLLVTPALLRDYASMRQPRRLQYTVYAGISLFPLYAAVVFRRGINPMIMIIVALVLSGVLAIWRYARLGGAPTAFPVGRLAA